MELNQAREIAEGIVEKLKPVTWRIHIAGSIRRGNKEEVKDIEILCQPHFIAQTDLFGEVVSIFPIREFYQVVESLGKRIMGDPAGRFVKIQLDGVKLDLFIPETHDYYRMLAIRTGSTDFSINVLAAGWKKIGWCGSDHGLRKMTDCVQAGKDTWKCIRPATAEKPPIWGSEREFFAWLGIDYVEPCNR